MTTETITEVFMSPQQQYNTSVPFPDDVPTAPLLRLSLKKLLAKDAEEVNRFTRACEDLGFFYLDVSGLGDSLLDDVNQLFSIGEELFNLPLDEKKRYDFQHKK
jgi:isopenicillin N synthase-like dioxygenase